MDKLFSKETEDFFSINKISKLDVRMHSCVIKLQKHLIITKGFKQCIWSFYIDVVTKEIYILK